MKNYRIELHANGKKETSGWDGFDEANAFFSTDVNPFCPTAVFADLMLTAVEKIAEQQSRHWEDYRIGKLFVQAGWEPVSVMSPAWEYHKGSLFPIWKEVYA